MSEKVFNERQRQAIDSRGASIVVSAAAGSGKTSVLTERVLGLIEQGEDIERMLIVTFTNLAASEMKERIYARLNQAAIDKHQPRLAVQAEKSIFSDISTIHVFCNSLIRDNFEYAGVSPTFSLASDADTALLKQRALDSAIEALHDKTGSFFKRYAPRANTSGIKSTVLKIYNRIISTPDPEGWLSSAQSRFESDEFIYVLFEEFKALLFSAAQQACELLSQRSDAWEQKGFHEEAAQSENERIEMLRQIDSADIRNVVIPALPPVERFSGAPYGEVSRLTNKANRCFEDFQKYSGDFFSIVKKQQDEAGQDGSIFIALTAQFMKTYARLKREKNVLDHDDSLHFANRVLSDENIAKRYQQRYTHVFVDEYQDINNVQHTIISRVKGEDNDFFVGDVKQCIYMFRESNPDLLIKRCKELEGSGLIEMNTNYRSAPAVINFINAVMQNMMTEKIGGVSYTGGHKLSVGKSGNGNIKICLPQSSTPAKTEALAIAANIKELIENGYSYSDIAILRPEVSGGGSAIVKTLSDMGIPVSSGFNTSDPAFSDVAVYVNLLKVIDGSADDVALLCVMRYPSFSFTEPEFAQIRIATDKNLKTFEEALLAFKEDSPLGNKVKGFFEKIDLYRLLSDSLSLPDFLMRLRHEALFDEYAATAPSGSDRTSALLSFINSASAMTHISGVIEVADRIMNNLEKGTTAEPDAVFFTTIHKSKGLEFPAVILSGMQKRINQSDAQNAVLIGRKLGLALDISDTNTHIKTPTLHKKIVAEEMRNEKICETVRLLYVGMTRAKERLIICGAIKNHSKKWDEPKTEDWQLDVTSYLDLIMPAVYMMDGEAPEIENCEYEDQSVSKQDKSTLLSEFFSQAEAIALPKKPCAYHPKQRIPSKLSVSAIKKQQSDEDYTPSYLPTGDGELAAQRGTLLHMVLQKIGLSEKTPEEVSAFIDTLTEEGLADKKLAAQIDPGAVSRFLSSPTAKRAAASQKCLFEAPFCLKLPSSEAGIANSEEPVIIQGVIDLCFIEDGSWVIIDYKSDKVTKDTASASAQKYIVQLELYSKALSLITGLSVKEKAIYFLETGQQIPL